MPTRASFLEFVLESLASLGPVTSKAMFGGHGIYLDGQIFGLVDDDKLFFKADAESRARFQDAGGSPFTYPGKKGPVVMAAYWTPPDDAMDSPDRLAEWGRLGLDAAARAAAAKKPKAGKSAGAKPAGAKSRRG